MTRVLSIILVLLSSLALSGCGTTQGAWDDLRSAWDGVQTAVSGPNKKTLYGAILVLHKNQLAVNGFKDLQVLFGDSTTGSFSQMKLSDQALTTGPDGQKLHLDFVWHARQRYSFILNFTDNDGQACSIVRLVGPFDRSDLQMTPVPLQVDLNSPGTLNAPYDFIREKSNDQPAAT